jgi:hypothetical protein
MSYQDLPDLRGLTVGGIPEDAYLSKIKVSTIYEDPNQLENHFRSTLKDTRPDAPTLASDEIRSSGDAGGGFQSASFLNLLHTGARSDVDPYLPDGTFLDFEFADRDSRGSALEPDMRKYRLQEEARGAFIKKHNDEDLSIPESAINPQRMAQIQRAGMYDFKSRYKNFDESRVGWHNGGTGVTSQRGYRGNPSHLLQRDGVVLDLGDATVGNRVDAVSKLSNDFTIAARHSTPDHRFKVSRFVGVKASVPLSKVDVSNNRNSTFGDQTLGTGIEGLAMNKSLAGLIIDLQGQKQYKHDFAKGANYNDSMQDQARKRALQPDDLIKLMFIGVDGSAVQAANVKFEGMHVRRYANRKPAELAQIRGNVQINHKILESMQQSNHMSKERRTKDLRDQVQSNVVYQFFEESKNRKGGAMTKAGVRLAETSGVSTESLTTKNYEGIKPRKESHRREHMDGEAYKLASKTMGQRKLKFDAKHNTTDDVEAEEKEPEFGIYDKAKQMTPEEIMLNNTGVIDRDTNQGVEYTSGVRTNNKKQKRLIGEL